MLFSVTFLLLSSWKASCQHNPTKRLSPGLFLQAPTLAFGERGVPHVCLQTLISYSTELIIYIPRDRQFIWIILSVPQTEVQPGNILHMHDFDTYYFYNDICAFNIFWALLQPYFRTFTKNKDLLIASQKVNATLHTERYTLWKLIPFTGFWHILTYKYIIYTTDHYCPSLINTCHVVLRIKYIETFWNRFHFFVF